VTIPNKTTAAHARTAIGVADEVWVAAALLHREFPKRGDFEVREIVDRAARERLHPRRRPGVYVHAVQHCVANRPPNPGRYRMLYETRPGHRRLFKPDDDWHPGRKDGRMRPNEEALPERHRELLEWYDRWSGRLVGADPILGLRGLGREIWEGGGADAYVARLRGDWP
jgi:hypothetical protein